jgi:uncharacterized repeat protein (TIGR02543 family)
MKKLMSMTSQIITILFIAFFLGSCGSGGSGGGANSTPTPTYTVTYNGNTNTGGSDPIDSTNYVQGQYVSVRGNTGSLVKTGYFFAGWNTQANGSGTTYTEPQSFAMGTTNVTLYARWTSGPIYKVTYDGNGNTGGSVPVDSTNYVQGQTVTVFGDNGATLQKTGYFFAGWNTQANGSGTTYTEPQSFTMGTTNVTLYAVWTANPTYKVMYNGNGNTGGSVPIDSTNYVQGQSVTVIGNTGSLVKTNYSFAGWNTQANGSGTTYTQAQTFTMGAANVILYAKWTSTATVTLSSITVTPANPTIAPGLTQQFTATGHYSDGSTQDITTTAIWSSSTTSVAVISNATGSNGLATAVAAGSSTITAISGSIPGSTTLTVNAASGSTTYIYYSSTLTTAQTATLDANGTLSMGALKLTGFSFGVSASDPSGTLTSWAAPLSNINQPNVPVMLFCGTNNKLAYVLLLSDANDPNRTTSSVVNLLSAVESASQYSGIGVYTDCSGTFTSSWNNDLPYTDYYLWPNVFNTYSYAYVASELNNAFIFYEAGPTSNPDNYLAVTWKGTTPFEVWK